MQSHLPGDRQTEDTGGRGATEREGVQDESRTRVAPSSASFFVCLARRAAIQVQESLTGIANSRLASAADY